MMPATATRKRTTHTAPMILPMPKAVELSAFAEPATPFAVVVVAFAAGVEATEATEVAVAV